MNHPIPGLLMIRWCKLHAGMPSCKTGRESPRRHFFFGTSAGFTAAWRRLLWCLFSAGKSPWYKSVCLWFAYTPAVSAYAEHICIDLPRLCIRNCNLCALRGTHLPTVPMLAYVILWTPAKCLREQFWRHILRINWSLLLTKRSSNGARRKRNHPQCDTHPLHKDTFHSANDFHPAVTVSLLSPTSPRGTAQRFDDKVRESQSKPSYKPDSGHRWIHTPLRPFKCSSTLCIMYMSTYLNYLYLKHLQPKSKSQHLRIAQCLFQFKQKNYTLFWRGRFLKRILTSRRATISSRGTGRLNEPLAVT